MQTTETRTKKENPKLKEIIKLFKDLGAKTDNKETGIAKKNYKDYLIDYFKKWMENSNIPYQEKVEVFEKEIEFLKDQGINTDEFKLEEPKQQEGGKRKTKKNKSKNSKSKSKKSKK